MSERLKIHIEQMMAQRRTLVSQGEEIARQVENLTIRIDEAKEALSLVTGEAEVQTRVAPADTSLQAKAAAWKSALTVMRRRGTRFTTDAIFGDLEARNVGMTRLQVRGRLSDMVEKGELKRISEGNFEFVERPHSHVLRAMEELDSEN
jgi:hypothetical protein